MMRQDEDLWIKKMRETFKDYSEPPAPDGWSKLEKELVPVRERRIRPYAWWAVAATLVLAVSGISLFFTQTPTADDIRHTQPPVAVVLDVIPGSEEEVIPYTCLTDATNVVESVKKATATDYVAKQIGDIPHIHTDSTTDSFDEVKAVIDEIEQRVDEQQPGNKPNDRKVVKPSGKDKLHLPVVSEKKRSSDGKWSVGASFSNAASASTTQTRDYLSMANLSSLQSDGLVSGMIPISDKSELVFDGGVPYLKQSVSITEIKHKQPISFGLSVRKNLSKGFSVETGLTYTMLSSEGKSVSDNSKEIEQKLHYIGVPVRGNWNFIESKRFSVYLTAGGMVEKCVYGKVGGEKETVKPLQFSLAGGVGGQLNITNRIGLYIEPGVSYFFDDGSDVETIRKENPLNFNLQGGIRFTY